MDHDPNHFPTLITVCVITTIILFILINMIIFFHERSVKDHQQAVMNEVKLTTDQLGEEEKEMTNYLQGVNGPQ
jgi:large-conductance mechanosensitive channel